MPAYLFECDCGSHKEVFREMKDAGKPVRCTACKKKMYRDFSNEVREATNPIAIWKKPKVCEASGCHKDQVPAERDVVKRYGLKGVRVRDDGCMEYDSSRAEKSYLKLYNMHNRDGD